MPSLFVATAVSTSIILRIITTGVGHLDQLLEYKGATIRTKELALSFCCVIVISAARVNGVPFITTSYWGSGNFGRDRW